MLRVLVIAPYAFLPAKSGGQQLIARFCEALGQRVRLWVAGSNGNEKQLAEGYELLPVLGSGFHRYTHPGLVGKLTDIVRTNQVDIVILEHPYLGWLANALRVKTGVPFLLHTHNVEHLRFKSLGKPWWPLLRMYEKWVMRKADFISYLSDEDKAAIVRFSGVNQEKLISLPYGINRSVPPEAGERMAAKTKVLKGLGMPQHTTILLFCGAMDYAPNTSAVSYLLDQFLPAFRNIFQREFILILCGRNLPAALAEKAALESDVRYLGFVHSIDEYNLACDLFLNTVMDGGGVKTKLVEALSAGAVAITTKEGRFGISQAVSEGSITEVELRDANLVAKTAVQVLEQLKPVSKAFYDYFFWPAIIDRLLAVLQRVNPVTAHA